MRKQFLLLAFLLALPAAAKPKHSIADYTHVGVLFIHDTGNRNGSDVYHEWIYTCVDSNNPNYGPDCLRDRSILMFRTDDGKEHLVDPTDPSCTDANNYQSCNFFKRADRDVLTAIFDNPKNSKAIVGPGIPFRYRLDGNVIYVPIGTVDKHGKFHVVGEKSYLL